MSDEEKIQIIETLGGFKRDPKEPFKQVSLEEAGEEMINQMKKLASMKMKLMIDAWLVND